MAKAQLLCHICGKPIWSGNEVDVYTLSATHHSISAVDQSIDRFPIDSGTFCSAECLMRYLMLETGFEDALGKLWGQASDMRSAMQVLNDAYCNGQTCFPERVRAIERVRIDALEAAWAEVDRVRRGEEMPDA